MSNPDHDQDKSLLYTNYDVAEITLGDDVEVPYMAQMQPNRFVELYSLPATDTGQPELYVGRHRRIANVIPLVSISPEDDGESNFLRRALETAMMYGGQIAISAEGQEVIYEHDDNNKNFADGLFAIHRGHIPEALGRVAAVYVIAQGLDEIEQLRQDHPPMGEAR